MMIETFEGRQMFSATTVDAVAPAPDGSSEPPVVVDADAVATKRGKVSPQGFNFTHSYDKASPVLA
jgi:hypothetical protein